MNKKLTLNIPKVTILGKTYPVKELLKKHGGVYNAQSKLWVMYQKDWEEIKKLENGKYTKNIYVINQIQI